MIVVGVDKRLTFSREFGTLFPARKPSVYGKGFSMFADVGGNEP